MHYSSLISNTSIIHIMDPKIDLDALLDQMVDEELEDNTKEQQVEVTRGHRLRRKVVHRNREEGHDQFFNDYLFENPIYT